MMGSLTTAEAWAGVGVVVCAVARAARERAARARGKSMMRREGWFRLGSECRVGGMVLFARRFVDYVIDVLLIR